ARLQRRGVFLDGGDELLAILLYLVRPHALDLLQLGQRIRGLFGDELERRVVADAIRRKLTVARQLRARLPQALEARDRGGIEVFLLANLSVAALCARVCSQSAGIGAHLARRPPRNNVD